VAYQNKGAGSVVSVRVKPPSKKWGGLKTTLNALTFYDGKDKEI
jgi:hypothetical protein